jgi:hypothetical protein
VLSNSDEKRNASLGGSSGDHASQLAQDAGSIRNGGGIPCLREKRKLGNSRADMPAGRGMKKDSHRGRQPVRDMSKNRL